MSEPVVPASKVTTTDTPDISWTMVLVNLAGLVFVGYASMPSAFQRSPNVGIFLTNRVGAALSIAIVVTVLFAIIRWRRERRRLRRSFVMAAWVGLGLVVLSEIK